MKHGEIYLDPKEISKMHYGTILFSYNILIITEIRDLFFKTRAVKAKIRTVYAFFCQIKKITKLKLLVSFVIVQY